MKTWTNKNSPLGRWLSSSSCQGKSFHVEAPRAAEPSPVDVAHWIMFGVLPSENDAHYWNERAESGSLYEFLQLMYDASSPSIASDWEKLLRLVGPGTVKFGRSAASPTMTIIRIYRESGMPTPDPHKVLRHLQAILRRPTDPVEFSRHIKHSINRGRSQRLVPRTLSSAIRRPFSEALVLNETFLIENFLRPFRDRRAVNFLSRAISPLPVFLQRQPSRALSSQLSTEAFEDATRTSGVDFTVLERALRPLLPSSGILPVEDGSRKIAEVFVRIFDPESPDALVVALYRLLLGREPEDEGFSHYVEMLKCGDLSVLEVVRDILGSEEYRSNNFFSVGG